MDITNHLIKEYGFTEIRSTSRQKQELDFDRYSCILRVHEIHYIFYSEFYKHFCIGIRHERPKKDVTGKLLAWTTVMIPKVIYTIEEADNLIKAII